MEGFSHWMDHHQFRSGNECRVSEKEEGKGWIAGGGGGKLQEQGSIFWELQFQFSLPPRQPIKTFTLHTLSNIMRNELKQIPRMSKGLDPAGKVLLWPEQENRVSIKCALHTGLRTCVEAQRVYLNPSIVWSDFQTTSFKPDEKLL
jgi:hypothetical protein